MAGGFQMVIGSLLLPLAAALVIWNEVRAVDTSRALVEGAGVVREARSDRVDPALEGQLVHVAGALTVPVTLSDPDFPAVSAPTGAVRLRRLAQTYLWQETSSRGGMYGYRQVWSDQAIDSSRFHQSGGPVNPAPRYPGHEFSATEATLGAYRLSDSLLRELGGAEAVLPTDLPGSDRAGIWLVGNMFYVGRNPQAPEIGDQRLTWDMTRANTVSVVARQRDAGFAPYDARSGVGVHLIRPGIVETKDMIAMAERENSAETWMLRIVGAGLLLISFLLLRRWRVP